MRILPLVLVLGVLTTVSIDGSDEESSGRARLAKKARRQTVVQTKQAPNHDERKTLPAVRTGHPVPGATVAPAVPPRAARPACLRDQK